MTGKRTHLWRGITLLAAFVGLVALPAALLVADDNGKREDGQGKYAQLAAEWWQWYYEQPVSSNPLYDLTGERASNGQEDGSGPAGKVFFLAGVVRTSLDPPAPGVIVRNRTITVPADKALFFPVYNSEWDNVDVPPTNYTVPELREFTEQRIDTVEIAQATLDGVSLADQIVRVKSPVFSYTLPDTDNVYQQFGLDITGTINPAVADGLWVYIPPLPSGEHIVTITAKRGTFAFDITYNITIP